MKRLEPRLDGAPLEATAALFLADYAPAEAAERLSSIVSTTFPSDPAHGLLTRAWWLFRIAGRLGELDDLEVSAKLMDQAKETCRQVALVWLTNRGCDCCVALRHRLEISKKGNW